MKKKMNCLPIHIVISEITLISKWNNETIASVLILSLMVFDDNNVKHAIDGLNNLLSSKKHATSLHEEPIIATT